LDFSVFGNVKFAGATKDAEQDVHEGGEPVAIQKQLPRANPSPTGWRSSSLGFTLEQAKRLNWK